MALTHVTAIRDGFADAVDAACNVSAPGNLEFMTSGDVEVATLALANPAAFGDSSSGVITANTITDEDSATGGTVALFKFEDGAASEVFRGTVTATSGGGDIELSSLSITATDKVSMTAFTYTACQ
jgi:hypothetical protein